MNLAAIPEKPVEADPHRLCQRQKQIDYGKNTLGYERYTEAIPRYDHLLQIKVARLYSRCLAFLVVSS